MSRSLSIQAGGLSSRMGQDKALLDFHGLPLIQRVLGRVAQLAEDTFVAANHPDKYSGLGVPIHPDTIPGIGALGGIFTSLKLAKYPAVFIVACDLPFVNPALLTACYEILKDTHADAVIPQSKSGLEPLHAVYRRDTCLAFVEQAIQCGKRRVISWHPEAQIHIMPEEDVSKYDPNGITFWNVNTPEEYTRALNFTSKST